MLNTADHQPQRVLIEELTLVNCTRLRVALRTSIFIDSIEFVV